MSMQGSAMMYVTGGLLYRREQLLDHLASRAPASADFASTWSKPAACARAQPGRVGVVREADDRDVRVRVGDLVRLDPGDVRDHELGLGDRVGR